MRKLLSYCLAAALVVTAACSDRPDFTKSKNSPATIRACASMEVLANNLAADPGLQARMNAIEVNTLKFIESGEAARLVNGTLEIPVVINIIYNLPEENISLDQINSQIDVLNEDFNKANRDVRNTPNEFAGLVANYGIHYTLAAVNRKYSTKTKWQLNDAMKKSKLGGIDPTDPEHNLNLWVVNHMTSGQYTILGYAQFPGGSLTTDGVVIGYEFFGRTGTVSAPYDKGRTATHEIGHWLNLRHIWGDTNCGDDYVNDTPVAKTSNFGCPIYPYVSSCGSDGHAEMTMNYMDYTDDACMYMFSEGQKARSMAIFAADGPRAGF